MKKIISLILATVMVFAIAAGASALTGDIYEVSPTTGGVMPYTNIRLRLVQSIPGAPGFGLLSLVDVAAGSAYYANQAIYFALEFTTPKDGDITIHPLDYPYPGVLISSTNVDFWPDSFALYSFIGATITEVTGPEFTIIDPAEPGYAKKVKTTLPLPSGSGAIQYILVGGGIVRGTASGAIRADFAGDIDCIKFFGAVTGSNIPTLLTKAYAEMDEHPIYSGEKLIYSVDMSSTTDPMYEVVVFSGNAGSEIPTGLVRFYTESDDTVPGSTKNVEQITVAKINQEDDDDDPGTPDISVLGDVYYVNDTGVDISGGGTSSLQFYRATGPDTLEVLSAPATGSPYADLKALYQGVMGFFDLQFSRQGILLPIHFAQKFSTFYAVSNEVKVALSTAVATDPDLELPATGDAATAAGFVMIALAIVAACGLAYRKVRG